MTNVERNQIQASEGCTPKWVIDTPKEEEMGMTRKDFKLIASVISEVNKSCQFGAQKEIMGELIHKMANEFNRCCSNFDRRRFLDACNVTVDLLEPDDFRYEGMTLPDVQAEIAQSRYSEMGRLLMEPAIIQQRVWDEMTRHPDEHEELPVRL